MTFNCRALVGTVAVLLTLGTAPPALVAGEIKRTVGSGESLSLICEEVYGDKELYPLIALYNGKDDPRKISAGETLRLPYSETVTLRSGESLSMLAKRVWGEPKMYPVLAWANGVKDAEVIPVGRRLSVPVLVPYTLKRGESASSVAGIFYGNPKVYEVILNASRIEDPTRVPAGALLNIPYVIPKPVQQKAPVRKVSRQPAKPAPKPVPKQAPKPPAKKSVPDTSEKEAMNLLEKAEREFKAGNYGDAWTMGNEASGNLQGREKARACRLMASAQYAFGKTGAALEDLQRAYELDPEFRPDPAYVNPEMMELYRKASGK